MIPHRRPHNLSAENTNHVRRVDSISCLWCYSIDGRAVSYLRGLQTEIDKEGLDDGTGDGEFAGVGSYDDAGYADELAEDDGEEGDESVDDETRVRWPETHGADPYQSEDADQDAGVVVRRGGEEECQCCPVGGERAGCKETDKTSLNENWTVNGDCDDAPEHGKVIDAGRVGGGIIGHEEPE